MSRTRYYSANQLLYLNWYFPQPLQLLRAFYNWLQKLILIVLLFFLMFEMDKIYFSTVYAASCHFFFPSKIMNGLLGYCSINSCIQLTTSVYCAVKIRSLSDQHTQKSMLWNVFKNMNPHPWLLQTRNNIFMVVWPFKIISFISSRLSQSCRVKAEVLQVKMQA